MIASLITTLLVASHNAAQEGIYAHRIEQARRQQIEAHRAHVAAKNRQVRARNVAIREHNADIARRRQIALIRQAGAILDRI